MEKYIFKEKIGQGSFGTVSRVTKNGISYALKEICGVNLFRKEEVDIEIEIMTKLEHPNLVKIYESHFDEENEKMSIIMDYCENGDFKDYIQLKNKVFTTKDMIDVIKQVANAFMALGSCGVIHRDLKLENLLVGANGQIKVADFGCARCLKNQQMSKIICVSYDKGSPCYSAPEILNFLPYSLKCDVWSMGCIIYLLAYGKHPFMQKNIQNVNRLIIQKTQGKNNIDLPNNTNVAEQIKYILRRCLQFRDSERASWRQFFLCRLFFQKVSSVKDYLDHLKCISNIANWISKTFWKERKKYNITDNNDEIFIYFIIRFQYSILKLGQKILERDPQYQYLFTQNAWKNNDIDQQSIKHYKTIYLKQTEDYFNILKKGIKSKRATEVIEQKQTNKFLVFLDLDNSIRQAYKLLRDIKNSIKPEDDKVMAIIARWVNYEKYFQFQSRPSLEKILVEKIDNVAEVVYDQLSKSIIKIAQ